MSYQEKENYISLASSVIVTIPYLLFIFNRFQAEMFTTEEEFRFWATAILLLIPARIVSEIVMHILAAIMDAVMQAVEQEYKAQGGEKEIKIDDTVDERDKLIGLKAMRNSFGFFAVGVVAAMLSIVLGGTPSTMFIIFIAAGFVSELVETGSKIFYYNRGF